MIYSSLTSFNITHYTNTLAEAGLEPARPYGQGILSPL
jgi:hypothetical protein